MAQRWTFGQRVGAGFALMVLLTMGLGIVAVYNLGRVVESKDRIIEGDAQLLIRASKLRAMLERKGGAARGFLITGDARHLEDMRQSRAEFLRDLAEVQREVPDGEARRLLTAVEQSEASHQAEVDAVVALRGKGELPDVGRAFDEQVLPKRDRVDDDIAAFVAEQESALAQGTRQSTEGATSAITLVFGLLATGTLLAIVIAIALTRTLTRQIGSAVGEVQSASAELQTAAHQQATGAREQATSMNEITTTITELLATARQIAEGAQRVAQVANQTATAARSGEGTVDESQHSIVTIRRQVDLVVNHSLELGTKSQQIGTIVDIVSELAEQTNILAINATIEAAGAGEAGKRFAVVADEIRKLADRVSVSAKEIRGLIDDVRGAVNTTVMATEMGSKAVDSGSRQFGEVSATFQSIAGLVTTTTEAAREIELSTKQQTTAVEQVNLAIANVAQATRETEASSGQTLQTASQLAALSKNLLAIVQPRTSM